MNPIEYIKKNKNELIKKFIPSSIIKHEDQVLICMAGSSGAGKTETSKQLIEKLEIDIVRVDADEIKEWIAENTQCDINDCHIASVIGVEKLLDKCFQKKYDILLDGTFTDLPKAINNIERALNKKRNYTIIIVYVYQSPKLAWDFIQKRQQEEGRSVPYDIFKETFIESIGNVIAVKEKFKESIIIHTVEKNYDYSSENYQMNVSINSLESLQKNVKIEHVDL